MGIEGIDDLKPDDGSDAATDHEPAPSGEPVEHEVVPTETVPDETDSTDTEPEETEPEVDPEAE